MREAPAQTAVLWVVGHQPTTGVVTSALADREASAPAALRALAEGFPTATAAVLTLEAAWADLHPGTARLVALRTARA